MLKETRIIISQGKRPLLHLLIASVFYTFSFFLIFSLFYEINLKYLDFFFSKNWFEKVYILFFTIPIAINYSSLIFTHLDLEKKKIKKEFKIGFIKWGYWKKLPKIQYVSVYKTSIKNDENTFFEINLWFKENEHTTIYKTTEDFFEEVYKIGFDVAKALNIKLLDATSDYSRDWEWINLETPIDTLVKEHLSM